MKLYEVLTRSFQLPWGKTTATWVGTDGDHAHQTIVPIRIPDGIEPIEDQWGIRASNSGRPLIQANMPDCENGYIARFSTYNGDGKGIGTISLSEESLPHFRYVTVGVGGSKETSLWQEALVLITGPVTLLLQKTRWPFDELITHAEGEVLRKTLIGDEKIADWIPITDKIVPRWEIQLRIAVHDSKIT